MGPAGNAKPPYQLDRVSLAHTYDGPVAENLLRRRINRFGRADTAWVRAERELRVVVVRQLIVCAMVCWGEEGGEGGGGRGEERERARV